LFTKIKKQLIVGFVLSTALFVCIIHFKNLHDKNSLEKQIGSTLKFFRSDSYSIVNLVDYYEHNNILKCTTVKINDQLVVTSLNCSSVQLKYLLTVDIETAYGRIELESMYLINNVNRISILFMFLIYVALWFLILIYLKSVEKLSKSKVEKMNFLKSLAHDVRSPLTALEMIVGQMDEISRDKRIHALQAIGRIQDIANGLLQNRTFDEALMAPIRSIVENLMTEKREALKKSGNKINLILSFDKSVYGLFSDVPQMLLKRVLSNLINNSVESLNSDGDISVKITKDGYFLRLIISDNGKGIPDKVMDKILKDEPVTFGKEDGNGIGLTHAKEVIAKYNGEIALESKEGEGTVVTIKLPLAEMPKWFAADFKISSNNIIILDDDKSIHDTWKGFLEGYGLNLYSAFSEKELLEHTEKLDNYQIISDFDLGFEKTGLDILIENNLCSNSILVTSFYSEADIQKKAIDSGIKISPKEYFVSIPIIDMRDKEIVFVDDELLLRKGWELEAKERNLNIKTFSNKNELEKSISNFKKNTLFYIDKEIGSEDGLEICEWLHAQDFKELYLATGHDSKDFSHIAYIKGVVGKEFPI
tara:strand:- start:140777 stop:142546 length:1770 start_codon:yes stop_codon:yes gene_type:complete